MQARRGAAPAVRAVTLAAAIALALTLFPVVASSTPATAAEPGYLTFLFQRAQVVSTDGCTPAPGTVTLFEVAQDLENRGLAGTAAAVTGQTNESTEYCHNDIGTYASWDQLATLRDQHGWTTVSTGKQHADITTMTPQQQYDESCGTLDDFEAHGHDRAWGLFAYPNNHFTDAIQEDLVSTCFAYGRKYVSPTSPSQNARAATVAPWFQWSLSVNGGNCNDDTLPCYDEPSVPRRYMSPTYLKNVMSASSDEWAVIQMYRFVDGARLESTSGNTWDCTDPDWTKHWTSRAELYCIGDFLAAVDAFQADPANAGVVTTDPATVAEAWGRHNPNMGGLHLDRVLGGPLHADIYPSGLEAYPGGGVVVADTGNNRVKRYAVDGSLLWDAGGYGADPGRLDNPRDVSVDDAGDVYVIDTRNFRVSKFAGADGTHLGSFAGPAGDAMNWPMGGTIAGVPDGAGGTVERLFVADTGRKTVREFALDGTLVRRIDPVPGTGCESLKGIRDATADAAGNVYVAGYLTNTIMKFDPAGGCALVWGATGTGDGQFRTPYGVSTAHDPVWDQDVLYVADAVNNRVQVFTLDGAFLGKFGALGNPDTPGAFTTMRRVSPARDGSGDVWAADLWGYRVQRWQRTQTGYEYAQTIGTPLPAATDDAVFQEPRGIAFAGDGTVAIIDTVHHRIVRMTQNGSLLGTCGKRGAADGHFNWPRGIALDPATGNFWVADTKQNRMQVVGPPCTPLANFGTRGDGPDLFDWPHGVAIRDTDSVAWIADTYNHRVRAYDAATQAYLGSYGFRGSQDGALEWPSGIGVDPTTGNVFVADTGNDRIVELAADPGGTGITRVRILEAGFDGPEGVTVDSQGRIWVADSLNNRVVGLDPSGDVWLTLDDGFANPANVTVGPEDALYVSDTYNDRVVVYEWGAGPGPDPTPDQAPPDTTVTAPTSGQVLPDTTVTMTGEATDDVAVAAVHVAITDRATGQWWQPGGGWGNWALLDATLDTPGTPTTTWTHTWTPPQPGNYALMVRTDDTTGNTDPTKPWIPFSITSGGTTDTTPPDTTVTTPTKQQALPDAPVTMAGEATDDTAVARVRVAIKDTATGQWWQPGGGWGNWALLDATLDTPGTPTTTWTHTWTPPQPGNYALMVRTDDTTGNTDPTKPWIPFSITSGGTTDTTPPDTTVTTPTKQQALPDAPVTMAGEATDDTAVARVRVAIKDTATGQWWQPGGGWGNWALLDATLDTPGTPTTTWTHTWTPPQPGNYALMVRTDDTTGNTDPTKPWIPFSIS